MLPVGGGRQLRTHSQTCGTQRAGGKVSSWATGAGTCWSHSWVGSISEHHCSSFVGSHKDKDQDLHQWLINLPAIRESQNTWSWEGPAGIVFEQGVTV